MAVWTIADTHLSFGVNKPMDIFPGWQNHAERLKKNWNALVGENDAVVIPGDISWGMTEKEALPDLQFLNALNGNKFILKGNHDYWWTSMKKLNDLKEANGLDTIAFIHNNSAVCENIAVCGTRGWMPDAGDDDKVLRREAGRLRLSLESALRTGLSPVAFLHYPPIYENAVCDEIFGVLKEYGIKRCFFGHLHFEKTDRFRKIDRDGITFSLVSADFLGFAPLQVAREGKIF
ncbi:MAG: metallophosphoesterase [Clostridia bacterium]|nr:metallophosphoesterase [Clostridia bacterium]